LFSPFFSNKALNENLLASEDDLIEKLERESMGRTVLEEVIFQLQEIIRRQAVEVMPGDGELSVIKVMFIFL